MTRQDLIDRMAEAAGISTTDAAKALDCLLGQIPAAVARGDVVQLRGFGVFGDRLMKARTWRNPRTGAAVDIPAQRVPTFRPGSHYKAVVNELRAGPPTPRRAFG